MKTIYLSGQRYTTLVVELDSDGVSVAGWGCGPSDYFGLELTDTERLLLAAALLRSGEHVERLSDGVSELRRMKKDEGGHA